jgi:pimeloyl-ACP methyl ester carboxylesterase
LLRDCLKKFIQCTLLELTVIMQKKSFLSLSSAGFHKVSYVEWGSADSERTILCGHGLTRNGRDFDLMAKQLSTDARVVCPDLIGRGDSAWLANAHLYNQAQYLIDMTALIARLNVDSITWVGTSLGGLLGMYLASQENSPITALILNDVGPVVPRAAIARIAKYAGGGEATFPNLDAAEEYIRRIFASGENLSDEIWSNLTLQSVRQKSNGSYTLAYDPKVSSSMFKFWFTGVHLWPIWERIRCPVLVLWGAKSDVLLPETIERMQKSGPKTDVIKIPNCGHAPSLMTRDQIDIINNWLQKH